ncbi:MAG: 4Fe-4S double cluster binding domain-containing protein [Candidatus Omnitrophota bacterium]
MEEKENKSTSRRTFIKTMVSAGALLSIGSSSLFSKTMSPMTGSESGSFDFKYRTMSVSHLPQLKEWIDTLEKEGKISNNPIYLKYINAFEYQPPKKFPNAQSVIILSIPLKIAVLTVNLKGKKQDILIPTGYVTPEFNLKEIRNYFLNRVMKEKGKRIEVANLPLKSLAVRTGLAEYGRNNITFVDGYGSYHMLAALYTDYVFPEDHWGNLKMMRYCRGCHICMNQCPMQCIRRDNFAIDAGKCISLYNELPDPIPSWIDPNVHNALVGCLKCQIGCPANEEVKNNIEKLAELTEPETRLLLEGTPDPKRRQSILGKLKRLSGSDNLAYIARNLKLALHIQ